VTTFVAFREYLDDLGYSSVKKALEKINRYDIFERLPKGFKGFS
jgi:hypothetical protein